jgi:hypothetical protein
MLAKLAGRAVAILSDALDDLLARFTPLSNAPTTSQASEAWRGSAKGGEIEVVVCW